ncbi:MAG: WbqC family protein [Planctomycetota bacterium]
MRLAVNHAYFFPYLGYFQAMAAVDRFLLYEHFDYIKDGWMHRNRLQGRNHTPFQITAHVSGRSSHRRISEIILVETRGWRKKLKKSLVQNYRGAPWFEETNSLLEGLIAVSAETLHEFNALTIQGICDHLGIKTEIRAQNDAYLAMEEALEAEAASGSVPEGSLPLKVQRLLRICEREEASMYINAIGGTGLYDASTFAEVGVDLRFVQTHDLSYPQFTEPFTSHLSIVDTLMFCGREGTRELLQQYSLVRGQEA